VSNCDELRARLDRVTSVVTKAEASKHLPPLTRSLIYLSKADQARPAGFAREMKRAAKQGPNALFEMQLLEAASRKRIWIADTVGTPCSRTVRKSWCSPGAAKMPKPSRGSWLPG
jgi:hypothetical protein